MKSKTNQKRNIDLNKYDTNHKSTRSKFKTNQSQTYDTRQLIF